MLKNTIIFRADGSQTIGMGHFIRTLALANMLKDHFYCIYATRSPTTNQIKDIGKICHNRIDLPADETHFNVFLDHLKGNEIVVLDNYYFTTEYQRVIKGKGCKLICIDDIHERHFVADVIINHAEGINKTQYSAEIYTKFLLGYKYALLHQEYLNTSSVEITKQYSCLLMMGGVDPFNLTAKIILMIEALQLQLPIAVVIGNESYQEQLLKTNKNIVLFKGIDSSEVYKLMRIVQFGILPASTVAIEACAARLPFICGYFVDNQTEIYNGIKRNNLAICIGNYLEVGINDFEKAFLQLTQYNILDKMKQQQIKLLDKKSKKRFVKIFNNL